MLGYLKKFNNLPAGLREKVSNQDAMAAIEELEKKYQLPLASLVMRVMVKEIILAELVSVLLKENLTDIAAGQLAEELKEKIFFPLGDYLSLPAQAGQPATPASPGLSLRPRSQASRPGEPKQNFASLTQAAPVSALKSSVQAARLSAKPLVNGASFFFSPDDEREVRELAKKIDLAEKTELSAAKIEKKLEAIINCVQINFGSADLADRFRQILKTYLRGIRNKLETKLTLIKPFLNGGLSFDEDSAQKVMTLADKIIYSVKSPPQRGVEQFNGMNSVKSDETIKLSPKIKNTELEKSRGDKPIVARDAPYDFSRLAKAKKKADLIEAASHELAPLTPALTAVKSQATAFSQAKNPPIDSSENKIFASVRKSDDTSQMPLIRRRFEAENLNRNQKVKVEDVKYIPRVMSPLDEIRYLDLINFRRLHKDPRRAIDKIKNKINLLEEEGYGKRMEAIKSWRSSQLNRLYLEIGRLSISGNKPVDVIIEERKAKASDYLTVAEFEAIMDLNKSLRF